MAQKVQIENFLSENAKAVRLLERTIQEIAAQKTVDERIALNSALASIRSLVESQDYRNSYRERPSIFENDFAIPISNTNVEMTVSWGLGMHKKRIEKNLDLEYVSSKTGIPVGVLDAFESGKAAPTKEAIFRVLSLECLDFDSASLLRHMNISNESMREHSQKLNCWIPMGPGPVSKIEQLKAMVNDDTDHIEQSYLYIDPASAADWCSVSIHKDYDALQSTAQYDRAANVAGTLIESPWIDVVALGSGDGRSEVRFVEQLIQSLGRSVLRLYLVDISHPLLSVAYRQAKSSLGRFETPVFAINADFWDLKLYKELLSSEGSSQRTRLFTMLGHTLSNLDNDLAFLETGLSRARTGDLLLLDFRLSYMQSGSYDQIMASDPAFSQADSLELIKLRDQFLTGPFRRYGEPNATIEVFPKLEFDHTIPGSYRVNFRVRIQHEKVERVCSVYFSRRYNQEKLLDTLRIVGWDIVDMWRYGLTKTPCMLGLFRKNHQKKTFTGRENYFFAY